MGKLTIIDIIEEQGNNELNNIISEGLAQADKLYADILKKANEKYAELIKSAQLEHEITIRHKQNEFELLEKQYVNNVERIIIDELFMEALKKLENLEGEELCNFVAKLIKKENLIGNEVMMVADEDYKKYLKALSNDSGDLVNADILNRILGHSKYNFQLSDVPGKVKSGFIIIGEFFDLCFDFKDLLENIQNKFEKQLSGYLFK